MRLASINDGNSSPDGTLVVVHADGGRFLRAPIPQGGSLRRALEEWSTAEGALRSLAASADTGHLEEFRGVSLRAPLPRSFAFFDGSAFLEHIILARRARGAEPPGDFRSVPLMYQGASDNLGGHSDPILLGDPSWGADFEGEIGVITDGVPRGTDAVSAIAHIKLLVLMNDITYRALVPREVGTGFGFVQSKPPSAFAPFAVTPDELGDAWRDGRVHLPLRTTLNGTLFGEPDCGEMHFSFGDLIAHAARTRELSPGTIIGSGTVSNADHSRGQSCIAERRAIESIAHGAPRTPWLNKGDVVRMEILRNGRNVFGALEQRVE